MSQKPTAGRIVHYCLPDGMGHQRKGGDIRPAVIVHVWSDDMVQLQVFTDSTNDADAGARGCDGLLWATSVYFSEEPKPGHWSWPPRA